MCRRGKIEDFRCTVCGFVDVRMKKLAEAVKTGE